MEPHDLEALRELLLKCYEWEVLEANPYYIWFERKRAEHTPYEKLTFQAFVQEHMHRLGLL